MQNVRFIVGSRLTTSVSVASVSALIGVALAIGESSRISAMGPGASIITPSDGTTVAALTFLPPLSVGIPNAFKGSPVAFEPTGTAPGRFAFTYIKQPMVGDSFLALLDLSRPGTGRADLTQSAVLPNATVYSWRKSPDTMGSEVFDPMWSPDGRYVLFKFGDTRAIINGYYLYVLDTQTNKLKMVSKRSLANPDVTWSPDSEYISYINNGDSNGSTTLAPVGDYIGPLELYVTEWKTGKEHLVVRNDTVTAPFSWTAPHSLLYTVLSTVQPRVRPNGAKVVRPSIYEYSADTGKSKLLIQDGYYPTVSLDDQWLAFFGSEDATRPLPLRGDWQDVPHGAALSVSHTDGSGRVALNRENGAYPNVRWSRSSQHLFTVNQIDSESRRVGVIKDWDVQTRHFRQVAIVPVRKPAGVEMPSGFSSFVPLAASRDGKTLPLFVVELLGTLPDNSAYISQTTLESVDVKTGAVRSIARLKNTTGQSWHDASSSSGQTG